MLIRSIGWLWIALGAFFFINPRWFKSYLTRTGIRQVRNTLIIIGFAAGGLLVAASRNIAGLMGTVLFWLGVIALFKTLLFLTGGIRRQLLDWSSRLPDYVYRLGAIVYITLGIFMLWSAR